MRNLVFMLRHDTEIRQLLGDNVKTGFWFHGDFREFKVRLAPAAQRALTGTGPSLTPVGGRPSHLFRPRCRAWPTLTLRCKAAEVCARA